MGIADNFANIAARAKELECPIRSVADFLPKDATGILFIHAEDIWTQRQYADFYRLWAAVKDEGSNIRVVVLQGVSDIKLLTRDELKDIKVQIDG